MDGMKIQTSIIKFLKNIDYQRIANNATSILEHIKQQALKGTKESTRMMLELYYVMLSDKTSKFNKLIIAGAFAYQFLPNDFLPNDFLPKGDYGILGYFDNLSILYIAYKRVKKSVTPEIEQKVENTINSWITSANNFTILKPEGERV